MDSRRSVRPWIVIGAIVFVVSLLPARRASAGTPIGTSFPISTLNHQQVFPSVAYNSRRQEYLVVWHNEWPGNKDVYGQRVSKNGTLVGPWFAISVGPGDRSQPDVAYNSKDNQYLVVWEHKDGSLHRIRAKRVTETGQPTGGEITIATPGFNEEYHNPVVAYGYSSNKFLVVWEYKWEFGIDVACRQVGAGGGVQGTVQFVSRATGTGDNRDQPDVAYNRRRNEYLVAWRQRRVSAGQDDIYARKVRGDGVPMYPESIEIYRWYTDATRPAVAAIPTAGSSGQYLVVFHEAGTIDGRFVNGDGTVPAGWCFISQSTNAQTGAAVAGNEEALQYLVAWKQPSTPPLAFVGVASRAVSTVPTECLYGPFPSPQTGVGGVFADNPAVAAGPNGGFLVAFDDLDLVAQNRDVWGRLWGQPAANRVFLPLLRR